MVAAAMLATNASAANPPQITSAWVNADRTVSVNWDIPTLYSGAVIINPTPATDLTGAMPFKVGTTLDYEMLPGDLTNYKTMIPLQMIITQPTTIYVQMQFNPYDPFYGTTCQVGDHPPSCVSQVVALTVNPICSPGIVAPGHYSTDLVKAAYYTKQLVHRSHWLRRHGHYVLRHGHSVWVKAVYRRISHPPVYQQVWHPPVPGTHCQ